VIGVVFADQLKELFASTTAAGVGLILTGAILMSTKLKGAASSEADESGSDRIGIGRALLIGTAQGLAICPGISRSGSTIAVALLLGVERELAARFSFLLAIPAVLGALAFELKDYAPSANGSGTSSGTGAGVGAMLLGAIIAAAVGIFALKLLLRFVRGGKLSAFAYYCWALGLLAIGYGVLRG
jgi:undecaprenyl-diphosphatase